MAESPR